LVGELESLGCEAILVGGSVLDIAAVEDTITQATKPVRGVLQASMVLRDTSLSTMSFGDWNAAVGPKVQGTWSLHHALKRHGSSLDFFLLFSSTSGVLGQPGQANYSAANTFLDSFVQYRHTQGLPAAVIDIGPIAEIGFVGRNQSVEDQFRSSAIYLLQEQDLLDSIQLMISPDFQNPGSKPYKYDDSHICKSQLAIGLRSTQPLSAPTNRHPMKTDARMAGYRNNEYHEDAASAGGNQELKQYLATIALDPLLLDTGEAATFIAEEIGKALFGFLMRDVSLVDLEQSPKTMGADSLVSIELRNWFKQNMGVDVTVLEILDAPTVHALGKHTANTLKTKLVGGGEAAKEEAEPTRGRYEKDWAMKAP
jgi:aryl carrier-like protein